MLGRKRYRCELWLVQTVEKIHINNKNRQLGGDSVNTGDDVRNIQVTPRVLDWVLQSTSLPATRLYCAV